MEKISIVGLVEGSTTLSTETVCSERNMEKFKTTLEWQTILSLYKNRFIWYYIINNKNGAILESYGLLNAKRFICEGA